MLSSLQYSEIPIENLLIVAKNGNDRTGNGSPAAPFATIMHSLVSTNNQTSSHSVILIMPGEYYENIQLTQAGTTLIGLAGVTIVGIIRITPGEPGVIPYNISNISIRHAETDVDPVLILDGINTAQVVLQNVKIFTTNENIPAVHCRNTATARNILILENVSIDAIGSALHLENVECQQRGYLTITSIKNTAVKIINSDVTFSTGTIITSRVAKNTIVIGCNAMVIITFSAISNNSPSINNANCIWVENTGVLAIGSAMLLSTAPNFGSPENTGFAITGEVGGFVNYVNLQFNGVDRIGGGPTLVAGDVEPTIIP